MGAGYGNPGEGYYGGSGFAKAGYGYSGGGGFMDPSAVASNYRSGSGLANSYGRGISSNDERTATIGGLGAIAYTAATAGKIAAFKGVGIGISSLMGVSMGAMGTPLLGLAAVGAMGAVGALGIVKGGPALINGIGKMSIVASRAITKAFVNSSNKRIAETHESYNKKSPVKSDALEKNNKELVEREQKFSSKLKEHKENITKDPEAAKEGLQAMYRLRIPSKQMKDELNKVTSDYIISKNTDKNGTYDYKQGFKDAIIFAKNLGMGFMDTHSLVGSYENRIEEKKDSLELFEKNPVGKKQSAEKEFIKAPEKRHIPLKENIAVANTEAMTLANKYSEKAQKSWNDKKQAIAKKQELQSKVQSQKAKAGASKGNAGKE